MPFIKTEKAIEDIENMVSKFEEIHYNPYFKTSQSDFVNYKLKSYSSWKLDSISFKEFMATGMKLSALLSGGHSYMDWQNPKIMPLILSYHYIPFTGKLSTDSKTLTVTKSGHSRIKIGTKIQAINGINIVDLYKECASYIGGIETFKNSGCEKVFPLYLFFNDKLKAPYSILCDNKEEIETPGLSINELIPFINDNNAQQNNYSFKIIDNEVGLISYNSCTGYKEFDQFLKTTFKEIKKKKITSLIIDIRENSGGNSALNDLLLVYITTKPYRQFSGRFWKVSEEAKKAYASNPVYEKNEGEDFMKEYMNTPNQEVIESFDNSLTYPNCSRKYFNGKTCFLIGPNTFSSANFLADAVKTYKISTLIGAATGENTNDFGEQISFSLKNSGCKVYISSTYDIGANGDKTVFEPVYPDVEVNSNVLEFATDWIKMNSAKKNENDKLKQKDGL
ncbi:MAG: hypothetical protein JKY30_06025 [Flavobacteriales bacterium]|nr:hypothetical protein [Flavobacteriales bacterium]